MPAISFNLSALYLDMAKHGTGHLVVLFINLKTYNICNYRHNSSKLFGCLFIFAYSWTSSSDDFPNQIFLNNNTITHALPPEALVTYSYQLNTDLHFNGIERINLCNVFIIIYATRHLVACTALSLMRP